MALPLAPPFLHRPYDGSSHPFTVGLKPIGEAEWLEPDPLVSEHLAEKERLLSEVPDAVFRAEDATDEAQGEVLTLVLDNLKRHHGEQYEVGARSVGIRPAGRTVELSGPPALMTAARLIQEDLVLMRAGPGGYRLAAACLCFPSSWSLAEKFGQSMTGIHKKVPGFNGSRVGNMVAKLFDNLKVGQLVCRFNWSIYPDAELYNPLPHRIGIDIDKAALSKLFLRVERQTLRRLPGSGDILFTIKVHHDPLAALERHPERAEVSGQLRRQLLALDVDQMTYKGLAAARDKLADVLMGL